MQAKGREKEGSKRRKKALSLDTDFERAFLEKGHHADGRGFSRMTIKRVAFHPEPINFPPNKEKSHEILACRCCWYHFPIFILWKWIRRKIHPHFAPRGKGVWDAKSLSLQRVWDEQKGEKGSRAKEEKSGIFGYRFLKDISTGTVQLPSKWGGRPRSTHMQVLLVLLLDLYPVKMDTSQNPPSLFFCESGCTLTSSASHARRGRDGFPNKGEERKENKIQHAGNM